MQSRLADDVKQLLRRIEEIPTGVSRTPAAPSTARPTTGAPPDGTLAVLPLARSAGSMLLRHRKVSALVLAGVVAIAGIVAAGSMPWKNESADDVRSVDDARIALAAPPPGEATPAPTTAAAAPAGAAEPVVVPTEPAEEAREQAGSALDALRPSIATPTVAALPKLTVQPIHAINGQRVRIAMRVEPGRLDRDTFQVSVRGLPRGARFDQGTLVAPDRWVIPGSALGTLELALRDTAPGRFELISELQGASGKPIARTKSALVVAQPPGHSLAQRSDHSVTPASGSRFAGQARPIRRVASATNCRPCRCFRASPIYWEYRGQAGGIAHAGPATTTCYVMASRLSSAQ
ncbi:MAG TPA: hypothetical protein VK281_15350 [Xanthobacteraceae bacterium]|nr:hypothetical protein [Xanthobacteraceae bacterium]